jgi:UDP-glucuronate 4-epimerase
VETILVTGGAGFIGSHLVERLLARGNRVICLENFDLFYEPEVKRNNIQPFLANERFELVQCDIRNEAHLAKVLAAHKIHSVVHLAARAGGRLSISNPPLYQHVNVGGTVSLLDLSKDRGISNFIFGSSSSVYGACAKIPFR